MLYVIKVISVSVLGIAVFFATYISTPQLHAQSESMGIAEVVELLIALDIIPANKVSTVREIVKSFSTAHTNQSTAPTCDAWVNKSVVAVDEPFVVYWKGGQTVRYAAGKFGDKTNASGSQVVSSGVSGAYEYPIKVYDESGNTGSCVAKVMVQEQGSYTSSQISDAVLMPGTHTLVVGVFGEGHVIAQGKPRAISCGALGNDCRETYTAPRQVTLTVTKGPRPQWRGCDLISSNGYNCKIDLGEKVRAINVEFPNKKPNVTISRVTLSNPAGMDFGTLGGVMDQKISVLVKNDATGKAVSNEQTIQFVVDLYEVKAGGKELVSSEAATGKIVWPPLGGLTEFEVYIRGGQPFDGVNFERTYQAVVKVDTTDSIIELSESDNERWTDVWNVTYYKG